MIIGATLVYLVNKEGPQDVAARKFGFGFGIGLLLSLIVGGLLLTYGNILHGS